MIDLKTLRENLNHQLEVIRDRCQSFWISLAPREKLILIIAGSLAGFFSIVFVGQLLGRLILESGPSVQDRYVDSKEVIRYISELRGQRFQVQRYDRLKSQRLESFDLEDFLSRESKSFGLELESVVAKRMPSGTSIEASEKLFSVKLKSGASLDGGLRFLSKVEDILGLRILELSMAPQFDDPSKLNISFEIALKDKL
jgi:hypothetical protein